jgi:DNA-binding MarR family transcriptional regulator/GNAT superfamily N-acetyltransferase
VTERIGALEDRYLARDRPLGEARVLWEIGGEGTDVRLLRTRLGLDSGYLSRLLRSLERSGLVTVAANDRDRRVRTARLTRAGVAERAEVDRRSDDLALSFLEPLSPSQRERLVGAMAEVERLLTAGLVEIDVVDPGSRKAQACLAAYFAELADRFENGFDAGRTVPTTHDDFRTPTGLFLVATLRCRAVGCGALRLHVREPAEIKRMWVASSVRGLGIGRRLLGELERHAASAGAPAVRLDTNAALVEAISLYRSAGYREIEAYNAEPYADQWFEKQLGPSGSCTPSGE